MIKKSILYVITKSVWGGAGKYVYDLATNSDGDFSVIVAAGGRDILAQRLIKAKIPYFEIKNFQRNINFMKEPLACFELIRLLLELKPDIIHTNSSKAGGTVGLATWIYKLISKRQPQMIFTAHGWVFAENRPKLSLALIKYLSKLTAIFYDKIICVSEYDRQIAIKNKIAPIEKLVTIHNGIDVNNLSFLGRKQAQQELVNKDMPLVIGTIAEWHTNKGLFYFLEASKNFNQPTNIILIGSGENKDKDKLYEYIRKHNIKNTHLYEWIPNAASYLKAFDIFVLPSIKEGLPYTILEAMFAKVPVIATAVGGIPEIIDDNINGFLVQPKNSQQLADKINQLILNKQKDKLTQLATEKINKGFTVEQMVHKTQKIYSRSRSVL